MIKNSKSVKKYMSYIICHKCEMCNAHIDGLVYDLKNYAYKIELKGKRYYFCSWKCMRDFEKKYNL